MGAHDFIRYGVYKIWAWRYALTLTFDLWSAEPNQFIRSGYWIFHVIFIETAQTVYEISR